MHDHGHVRSLLEFVRFDQVRLSFIQGCIKFRIPPPGGGGNWFQNRKLLGREIKKREGKKGKGKEKKKGREGEKRREGKELLSLHIRIPVKYTYLTIKSA